MELNKKNIICWLAYTCIIILMSVAIILEREAIRSMSGGALLTAASVMLLIIYAAAITVLNQYRGENKWKNSYYYLEEKHTNLLKSYEERGAALDKEFQSLCEETNVLPQEVAILSNLRNSSIKTSTIKGLLEFYRMVEKKDTLFLIKVSHDTASWRLTMAGESIDLRQALYVLEASKEQIKKFKAGKSLIEEPKTIYN